MDLSKNLKYYKFLDGLRAVAILWVMFHHMLYRFNMWDNLLDHDWLFFIRFCYLGFLGVDIFFVISGFLIAGILIDDLNSNVRVKRFYVRRFLKIVPHYYFVIMITFILSIFILKDNSSLWPLNSYFFFYQNYVEALPVLGHLWSIAVEEHFYLGFPVLLLLVSLMNKDPADRKRSLMLILLILILAGNYLRFIFFKDLNSINDPSVWQTTHVRFDALVFGCLLRLLEPYLMVFSQQSKKLMSTFFLLGGSCIFLFFYVSFNKIGWFYYTLAYVASGMIILAALLGSKLSSWILESKVSVWIGRNSYGIYLWHYFVAFFCNQLFAYVGIYNAIVIYFLLSLFLGFLTTVTVERYFLSLRKFIAP